jgi:hypothetical protein
MPGNDSILVESSAAVKVGTGKLTLTGDLIDLSTNAGAPTLTSSGGGQVLFQPLTASQPIILGGNDAAGTSLVYTDTDNSAIAQGGANGFAQLTIGSATGSGAVTTASSPTFGANTTVQAPNNTSGGITVSNTLSVGSNTLTLDSGNIIATSGNGLLVAGTLALQAGASIGSAGTPLHMTASTLTANSAAGNGNQFLSASGTVQVTATNGLNAGSGTITLTGGTFLVDGSTAAASPMVVNGGALGGKGAVGGSVQVNTGATVSPGSPNPALDIATLQTGSVTFGSTSTFTAKLGGTAASPQSDQLNSTGTLTLTGATLDPSELAGVGPFTSGQQFVILKAAAPLTTTFQGLQEGHTVSIGGQNFTISYQNDQVTLTAPGSPPVTVKSTVPPPSQTGTTQPPAQGATVVALKLSINPAVPGQLVTFTVTVSAASGTPTGSVILAGLPGGSVALALQNGSATFQGAAPLGRFVITASYSGDSNFLSSQGSIVTQTVQTLAAEPDPRHKGRSIAVVGATAGKDLIIVTKHGKQIVISVRQLTHGHLHTRQVFAAKSVTEILIVGGRRNDQVQLVGVKLPVVFVAPALVPSKSIKAHVNLDALDAALAEWIR